MELHYRVQLGLVRTIEALLESGGDRRTASTALERLLELTRAHFAAEELLMRDHAYPQAAAHAEMHQRLLGEALTIGQQHLARDPAAAREVSQRLREWITDHVHAVDAAFAEWCEAKGIRLD